MSRLKLNFELETREERVAFLNKYINEISFTPNEAELKVMTDYVLWGKENGLNGRQEGLEIETKKGTWDETRLESLDALIEAPSFNESSLRQPTDPPSKAPRQNFSRSRARRLAKPHILEVLEDLWRRIDTIELELNFYEIEEGKRTEIRSELLERFSEEERTSAEQVGRTLTPYMYLKKKHQLVELRREQYTYRDFYAPTIQMMSAPAFTEYRRSNFGSDIEVFPVGLKKTGKLWDKVFRSDRLPEPDDFSEEELKQVSKILWKKKKDGEKAFDFRDQKQLYEVFEVLEDLEDAAIGEEGEQIESNLRDFLSTLKMYRSLAKNEDYLEDILEMKVKGKTNQQIADFVNQKYGKKYKPNYISTLYCQKCLANIARAAMVHQEVLENLSFPENFRKCKDCGEVLLLNSDNFVRRSRDSEGFSPRCKKCEKIKRGGKK